MSHRATSASVLILTMAFGASLQAQQRVAKNGLNPLTGKASPVQATYNPYTGGQHAMGAQRNPLTGAAVAMGADQTVNTVKPMMPSKPGAGNRNPLTGAPAAPVAQRNPLTGGVHYNHSSLGVY